MNATFDRLQKATSLLSLIDRYLATAANAEQVALLKEAKGHAAIAVRTLKANKANPNGGTGVSIKLITKAAKLLAVAKAR